MDLQSQDEKIKDTAFYNVFRLIHQKKFDEAQDLIQKGIKSNQARDAVMEGLYWSAQGVLHKVLGEFQKSYKAYQKAEQLIPDDPSLKIVTSFLLIDQFAQYDTASRKLQKLCENQTDPAILHHAYALLALSAFKQGDKILAQNYIDHVLGLDFKNLRFAANVNFDALEAFIAKGFALPSCQEWIEKALALANKNKEKGYILALQKLKALLPK